MNSLLALLTACGAAALLGPLLIPVLHRLKFGQNVRDDGPQTHLKKQDTPTMGGVIILIAIVLATLIFARKNYTLAIIALLILWRVSVLQEKGVRIRQSVAKWPLPIRWAFYMEAIFAVLIFGVYGPGTSGSTFVYMNY